MARNFEELRAKMSPEARAESDRLTQKMLAEIALQDLRVALNLTQAQVAEALATLRRYIEAMSGRLELVASFPDRRVVINQFDGAA